LDLPSRSLSKIVRGATFANRRDDFAETQPNPGVNVIELESIGPHLETVAEDWSNGVDHGAHWPAKIFAAKYRAVEGSWRVVDLGLDVTGGTGIFRSAGYERLIRDARLGRIHPANSFLTHEVVAKTALDISLDEQTR
jgi:alkylation response protein AidB-like acyl-CoA dehydrogenase